MRVICSTDGLLRTPCHVGLTKPGSEAGSVVPDGLAALDANRAVKTSGVANALMAESIRLTPRGVARRLAGSLQKFRT